MKFESKVTVGNILEILVIVISVLVGFYKLQSEQTSVRNDLAATVNQLQKFDAERTDKRWAELRRMLEHIQAQLDDCRRNSR